MTGIAAVWAYDLLNPQAAGSERAKIGGTRLWTDDMGCGGSRFKDRAKSLSDASEASVAAMLADRDKEIAQGSGSCRCRHAQCSDGVS